MNDLICVTAVEGEPRVLDTELAAALGYAVPAQIRRLIGSHEDSLKAFGTLITATVKTGGRPATAYYLNKPQAVFLTTQAGTPTAVAVTVQVIQKFDAYERGLIQAAPAFRVPQTFAEALRLAADKSEELELTKSQLIEVQAENDAKGEIIGKNDHTLARFVRTIDGVNVNKVKHSLYVEKYLYRPQGGGAYRVYRHFRHLFEERFDGLHGNIEIYPTKEGKTLLLKLNKEGKLVRTKSAAKVPAKRKVA